MGRDSAATPEEPLKFKPERHLKDGGSEVVLTEPDLRMLSYSTGKRGCAAVTLGTTMTAMLFARFLHGFTWNVPPAVSSIDLKESVGDLSLAQPLLEMAQPGVIVTIEMINMELEIIALLSTYLSNMNFIVNHMIMGPTLVVLKPGDELARKDKLEEVPGYELNA
ncbi:unnamed protein product, partial [Ilex paraguariensis]